MSRTSQTNSNRVPSPIRYYVSFSGEKGTFSYWDSANKERVDLGSEVEFVVMDTRSAITGWNDAANAKIFSNRVKSVVNEELTVRCDKQTLAKGLYSAIKGDIVNAGGKFCTEVFALMKINGEFAPVQLDLSGASLGCWMAFVEGLGGSWAIYKDLITTKLGEQKKKGRVTFFEVAFGTAPLSEDANELANAFNDDKLQPYLNNSTATQEAAVV